MTIGPLLAKRSGAAVQKKKATGSFHSHHNWACADSIVLVVTERQRR